MKRVLLTGGSGFVGGEMCKALARNGYVVRVALRTATELPSGASEAATVGDINGRTDWTRALEDVERVVHLAARAHRLDEHAPDLYMQTNALGTRRLAEMAARSGVRRFVYLSSIKVNGEETAGHTYTGDDIPNPIDDYGRSKWLGEQHLTQAAAGTAMEAAIVRSPLVYGPGVRANFLRLLSWIDNERLLPLAAVNNRRSLVNVWNLTDLLVRLLTHSAAQRSTWMVSDGEDLSTPNLIRRIAAAMGRRDRLLSVPVALLKVAGRMTGHSGQIRRLCGSLAVDIAQTRRVIEWSPPVSLDEGLDRTVRWYRTAGPTV